jgi:hypothetical protein
MVQPTGTHSTYDTIGIRESLSDFIYRVVPTMVPFTNNIGRETTTSTKHEWQTQDLASASDANAQVEGDDAVADAAVATVRPGNFTQISRKTIIVSGTNQEVTSAGRQDELDYQRTLKGLELARDVERQMLSNQASVAGNDTTARVSGGMLAWLTSNTSRGTGGTDGGFQVGTGLVNAATNGTQRTFTEALVKSAQADAFTNGGQPNQLYMSGPLKQTFSGFSGISDIRNQVPGRTQATIIGAADVYVGDFGELTAIPHPYGTTGRDAIGVDPNMAAMVTLRPMQTEPLAKTGDADKELAVIEYTLQVRNEAAHFVVADLS